MVVSYGDYREEGLPSFRQALLPLIFFLIFLSRFIQSSLQLIEKEPNFGHGLMDYCIADLALPKMLAGG